jgi:hypothetical protein
VGIGLSLTNIPFFFSFVFVGFFVFLNFYYIIVYNKEKWGGTEVEKKGKANKKDTKRVIVRGEDKERRKEMAHAHR